MAKKKKTLKLEEVKEVLQTSGIESEKAQLVLEELQELLTPDEEDEDEEPKPKKEYVVMLYDEEGKYGTEPIQCSVLQILEGDNPATVSEKIKRGCYDYNSVGKGRKQPVRNLAEGCEVVQPAKLKVHGVFVKTRETVWAIPTDNVLNMEDAPSEV